MWGEDASKHYRLRGRRDIARHLAAGLLERDIGVAHAYRPLHHASLAHAFANAILTLVVAQAGRSTTVQDRATQKSRMPNFNHDGSLLVNWGHTVQSKP